MPALIAVIITAGIIKRVNVFEAFIEGAKQGVGTVVTILPTLCTLFFLIGIFMSSGASDIMSFATSPFASLIGLPDAVIPLMILRPLSGSGAMAFFKTVVESFGVDSFTGRVAAVMLGSSETTMYTVSVYYGAAGVKKTRHTIPCALIGDFTAFITAGLLVRLFFK